MSVDILKSDMFIFTLQLGKLIESTDILYNIVKLQSTKSQAEKIVLLESTNENVKGELQRLKNGYGMTLNSQLNKIRVLEEEIKINKSLDDKKNNLIEIKTTEISKLQKELQSKIKDADVLQKELNKLTNVKNHNNILRLSIHKKNDIISNLTVENNNTMLHVYELKLNVHELHQELNNKKQELRSKLKINNNN